MPVSPTSLLNLRPPWTSETTPARGRTTIGKTIEEWCNQLGHQELDQEELRAIVRATKGVPVPKQAAALRLLRMAEAPDLADFEPYLDGSMTLADVRASGTPTEAVKKAKVKTRTDANGNTEVEREIELYDRSGPDFDRVMDRTAGGVVQAMKTIQADSLGYDPASLEELGRLGLAVGVPWEKLPAPVRAVTPKPVVSTVVETERK